MKAPFTPEQVAALNEFQKGPMHPFTCPGDKKHCYKDNVLVATEQGWVCACGEYTQDWAHDFMVEPMPSWFPSSKKETP